MMPKEFNNRVLVIDDEDVVRSSIREILMPPRVDHGALDAAAAELFDDLPPALARSSTTFDFEVEEASSGQEGLDALVAAREQGRPFALVFLDVRMPGWDGVETAQHIRAVDREVEIVFVTAYSDYGLEEMVAQVGADVGYHCKPFAPEEIRQIATKAAYDWNKLRSLESLISVVSDLGGERSQLEALLDNVLHQVADWTGTRSVAVLQQAGDQVRPVLAAGELKQGPQLAPMLTLLQERGLPEAMWREERWLAFALGDYAVVALLDPDHEPQTDRLYLIRLLLEHASRAIENARLQQALVQAQTLSMLGVAMNQVIHDLRQPLAVIDGMLEVMPHAGDEAELQEAYQWMKDASLDMQGYVDSILAFSRNEQATRELTDVGALFERIRERAAVIFRKEPTRLVVDVSGPISAHVDAQRVQRAVLNLCKNAMEALRDQGRSDGTVQVQVRAEGNALRIDVIDDGPGVPAEVADTLFEPFVTYGKSRGVGLGLSIAAQTCSSHGGVLQLLPEGPGARFSMTLPLGEGR